VVIVAWCALVALGAKLVYGYETGEGLRSGAPETWPQDSTLSRAHDFTLVMFLHPECPCSRASLAELSAIADDARGATIEVVFVDGEADGVSWRLAGQISRVVRVVDLGGVEARRFGAMTSGHVVLYDRDGRLRFSGGITGSRGHVGDNVGARDVLAVLRGEASRPTHAVFGCALHDRPDTNEP
jgi:hypothetical protein